MSGAETFIPTPLILTDRAAARVRQLAQAEHNPALKLRVYVTGGGCSGFQYGFDFSDEVQEDDTVIENGGVSLLVDPLSYQYLVGSTVDFEEGLAGARFLIQNPNATTTCGCGISFTV
ncbi:iron-sulfur cluster insertion protein ErpA [Halotalea alkalilenta]|uniref:Iron-sulfur cluster insertion protein ErpA n=1 Tax=Halotalea alkalilenta TaxID=376489 RepID=A0A172YB16_9GAMM|nr:iron-sulfur cluster insertion protein ErpA [Halotalea alkalilenta]ANF56417.1 iron-sulfur cluster insertion protein ErpA [Halotalea alkalilenta]